MEVTNVILRSKDKTSDSASHADFWIQVNNHVMPSGPFTLKLVSASIPLTGTDDQLSIHCDIGSLESRWDSDTRGGSDCIGIIRSSTENSVQGPDIHCSSTCSFDRIRVRIRNPETMAIRSDVDSCTLILRLKRVL